MSQHDDIFGVGCPNCGKIKTVRRSDDGKRVRCSCGVPFSIKLSAPSTSPTPDTKSNLTSKSDHIAVEIPVSDQVLDVSSINRKACPVCGELIVASAIKCRFCGESISTEPASDRFAELFTDLDIPERCVLSRESRFRQPHDELDLDSPGSRMRGLGVLISILSALLILFFAVIYDTSVPEYPGDENGPRIINVHRMQNRWTGIVIGSVGFLAGIPLVIAGNIAVLRNRDPAQA